MADVEDLAGLMAAIAARDRPGVLAALAAAPGWATATIAREEEFFLVERSAQVYAGDTALHAAAFSYAVEIAGDLVLRGAPVRARNRRGAEPLHAATIGAPGSATWDPAGQVAVIEFLVGAGADPNAVATGGVTPMHRAVRNRCSAAVAALLRAGADPVARNDHGSTPADLARRTTGRGGVGSAAAKIEQRAIMELLTR